MAEVGWSQLDRHREAHDLFLVDLQRRSSELRERGLTASFRHWTLRRVLEWFRLHIMTNDFGLGRFLADEKDPAPAGPGDPERSTN
jgi:hemerythrin